MSKDNNAYIKHDGNVYVTISTYARLEDISRQQVYNRKHAGKVTFFKLLGRNLIQVDAEIND